VLAPSYSSSSRFEVLIIKTLICRIGRDSMTENPFPYSRDSLYETDLGNEGDAKAKLNSMRSIAQKTRRTILDNIRIIENPAFPKPFP